MSMQQLVPDGRQERRDAVPDGSRSDPPQRPAPPRSGRRPFRAALLSALVVWLTQITVLLTVSALSWVPGGGPPPAVSSLVLRWNGWDAQHYVAIATHGYGIGPGYPAFFPLYPLLIRVFDPVLPGGATACAVIIANLSTFGALTMVHRLTSLEFGREAAQRAAFYLAAFPSAFFLLIGFNESLFLLLTVSALYASRRGHWWIAGILGGLASGTRLFGVLLALPMAIEYLRQHRRPALRIRTDALAVLLVPTGLLAYSGYCWWALGNPLAFSAAQEMWRRRYTFPGQAWLQAVLQRSGGLLDYSTVAAVLEAGSVLLAAVLLVLCVCGPWRFRRDQLYLVAHSALIVLLLTSTAAAPGRAMQSSGRYIIETVAMFLVLARIGANSVADRVIIMMGASLQAALLIIFMSGAFFIG